MIVILVFIAGWLAAVNTGRKAEGSEPVTMGHIRGHGVTRLLVYCGACNHSTVLDGASLPDDLVPRSLGPRLVCKACGHVGADVRPDWSQHTNAAAAGPGGAGRV
jgi:hypothetical protein